MQCIYSEVPYSYSKCTSAHPSVAAVRMVPLITPRMNVCSLLYLWSPCLEKAAWQGWTISKSNKLAVMALYAWYSACSCLPLGNRSPQGSQSNDLPQAMLLVCRAVLHCRGTDLTETCWRDLCQQGDSNLVEKHLAIFACDYEHWPTTILNNCTLDKYETLLQNQAQLGWHWWYWMVFDFYSFSAFQWNNINLMSLPPYITYSRKHTDTSPEINWHEPLRTDVNYETEMSHLRIL